MRAVLGIASALAALVVAMPASAAALMFEFSTNEPFAGGTVAFTYQSDTPVPIGTFIQRDALTSATPGLARIRFADACFILLPGQPSSTACDIVEAIVNTPNGSTQLYRFFADGALTTPGTYASLRGMPATFTVTAAAAAVPEPATWAVLTLGTAAVGGSLRTRRRATVQA